jgi:hypothetical protein
MRVLSASRQWFLRSALSHDWLEYQGVAMWDVMVDMM